MTASSPTGSPTRATRSPKTYLADVEGLVDNHALKRLTQGVTLEDGPARADKVKLIARNPQAQRTQLQITLHEGRNRIVRRMMDAIGHPVNQLARISIGRSAWGQLKAGEWRDLTREELGGLLDLVQM